MKKALYILTILLLAGAAEAKPKKLAEMFIVADHDWRLVAQTMPAYQEALVSVWINTAKPWFVRAMNSSTNALECTNAAFVVCNVGWIAYTNAAEDQKDCYAITNLQAKQDTNTVNAKVAKELEKLGSPQQLKVYGVKSVSLDYFKVYGVKSVRLDYFMEHDFKNNDPYFRKQ